MFLVLHVNSVILLLASGIVSDRVSLRLQFFGWFLLLAGTLSLFFYLYELFSSFWLKVSLLFEFAVRSFVLFLFCRQKIILQFITGEICFLTLVSASFWSSHEFCQVFSYDEYFLYFFLEWKVASQRQSLIIHCGSQQHMFLARSYLLNQLEILDRSFFSRFFHRPISFCHFFVLARCIVSILSKICF